MKCYEWKTCGDILSGISPHVFVLLAGSTSMDWVLAKWRIKGAYGISM